MPAGYDVLLRDGAIAHVRPLRPSDRHALHELVDRSSERSAYLRFFTGGRNTAHAYMDRVTGDTYCGHALVADLRGRLVAVAEYIPVDSGTADLAILLDDAVHGHGLGTLLLEHVAIDAAEHGVRELVADVLAENRSMMRVLHDLGLDMTHRADGDVLHVSIAAEPTARLRDEYRLPRPRGRTGVAGAGAVTPLRRGDRREPGRGCHRAQGAAQPARRRFRRADPSGESQRHRGGRSGLPQQGP